MPAAVRSPEAVTGRALVLVRAGSPCLVGLRVGSAGMNVIWAAAFRVDPVSQVGST